MKKLLLSGSDKTSFRFVNMQFSEYEKAHVLKRTKCGLTLNRFAPSCVSNTQWCCYVETTATLSTYLTQDLMVQYRHVTARENKGLSAARLQLQNI